MSATRDLRLTIESLSYGPYGVGRHGGRAVFVPLSAPGDRAEVRIVEDRGSYAIGEITRLAEPSPLRQDPPCPYFAKCGGCPWQQIGYEAQLEAKQANLADALARIGKLKGFEILPIVRSPLEYRYRRRIRLQADAGKRLGFHRAFSHELIEIDSCLIADAETERHLGAARQWARGLASRLRHLEIARGDEDGAVVLCGKAEGRFEEGDDARAGRFLQSHPEIQGLILFGRGWRRAWGREKLRFRSGGLEVEVDADAFSQVNRDGNREILRLLLEWGEFHGADRLLELYSGSGNFTLPVAARAREVVAVEGDARAAESGRAGASLHGLRNIRWLTSHAPRAARRLKAAGERFTKIILNPPRSGAKDLGEDLAGLGADKILYVSCNPATLARDLAGWSRKGYRLTRAQPVDLFPHSFHVEAVAELAKDA